MAGGGPAYGEAVTSEAHDRFAPAVGAWQAGLGGIRDVVRQEVLRRQLAEITSYAGSVVDVGCGQGTQALHLARAGHRVVGLDVSAELLARFESDLDREPDDVRRRVRLVPAPLEEAPDRLGERFDLVLCHGVLMYYDDPATVLTVLDALAGPDGRLSLLVRNGLAPALRDGLRGRWDAALAAYDTLDYTNRLGLPAHAHTPEQVDALLEPWGWRRERWYGVRVLTDHRGRERPDPEELAPMLAAETEAGRRDPYRQVAALLHLVYERLS